MPSLIDLPSQAAASTEAIHFPWAHVEDFRRFFGIDRLLDYSRKRSSATAQSFARMLAYSPRNNKARLSLEMFAVQSIAIGQILETLVEVRGKLASYKNLDAAVRSAHPELAFKQREKALAEYLYSNEVLPKPDMEEQIKTSRLAGILAHHAPDFWIDEHEDLFALSSLLQHAMQVRFVTAALLDALPQQSISPEQATRFTEYFGKWRNEIMQSILESKSTLDDSPQAITKRANLQLLHERTRIVEFV